MRTVVLLAAAALVFTVGAAAQGTKGQALRGYTFVSDVTPYLGVSKDICAIKKVINSRDPDYGGAQNIYSTGSTGSLALKTLATSTDSPGAFWSTSAKHFKDPAWLDTVTQGALDGVKPFTSNVLRVQLIAKTLENSLQVALVMRSLDQAVDQVKAKKLDAATGAPSSVDRAWAVFVGGEPACGLWAGSLKRAALFGTKTDCDTSNVAANVRAAMISAQKAAAKGDLAALTAARNAVQGQLAAVYVQATIAFAHEMYLDRAAQADNLELPPTLPIEDQAQAYAFFRVIAPLVFQANATAGQAINFLLYPGQPAADDVDLRVGRALASVYKGLGVTPTDVGQYGKQQPDLGCATPTGAAAPAAPAAGGARRLAAAARAVATGPRMLGRRLRAVASVQHGKAARR